MIGIDIGGANTKIASPDGKLVELHYIPLWKDTTLPQFLKDVSSRLQPEAIAVVMTGELADCFDDKKQGVDFIMKAVEDAFDCDILYVDNRGLLKSDNITLRDLAAANWAASANLIGKEFGDCIFVDVGSTTSDIIPIRNKQHQAGSGDLERLLNSELIYAGTLRTTIPALLTEVELRGKKCRLSSEFFAGTADVYTLLGDINEKDYTCETADGAGRSKTDCMRRVARVVCADLKEVTEDELIFIAKQIKQRQIDLLCEGVREVGHKNGLNRVVCAGLGEFLIREAAEKCGFECISASEKWGDKISKVLPAYAAARMLEEDDS